MGDPIEALPYSKTTVAIELIELPGTNSSLVWRATSNRCLHAN